MLDHRLIQPIDCKLIHREHFFDGCLGLTPGCPPGCHFGIEPDNLFIFSLDQLEPIISGQTAVWSSVIAGHGV